MLNGRSIYQLSSCLALVGLTACSGPTIIFESAPEKAEVLAHSAGLGGEFKSLGQTPLTLSASEITNRLGGSGPAYVEFKKDGYLSNKILITDLTSASLTVNTELSPSNGLEDITHLNTLIDQMFEGQRLARAGRHEDALRSLSELKKHFPQVAAIYELEGGIYYINKRYKEALDSYGLAMRFNPKNMTTVHIHDTLETVLGIKKDTASSNKGKDLPEAKKAEEPKAEEKKAEEVKPEEVSQ